MVVCFLKFILNPAASGISAGRLTQYMDRRVEGIGPWVSSLPSIARASGTQKSGNMAGLFIAAYPLNNLLTE